MRWMHFITLITTLVVGTACSRTVGFNVATTFGGSKSDPIPEDQVTVGEGSNYDTDVSNDMLDARMGGDPASLSPDRLVGLLCPNIGSNKYVITNFDADAASLDIPLAQPFHAVLIKAQITGNGLLNEGIKLTATAADLPKGLDVSCVIVMNTGRTKFTLGNGVVAKQIHFVFVNDNVSLEARTNNNASATAASVRVLGTGDTLDLQGSKIACPVPPTDAALKFNVAC